MISRFGLGLGGVTRGQGVGVNAAAILSALQTELTTAGIWAKLDRLSISTSAAPAYSLSNLILPGTRDLALAGSPLPTLALKGYQSGGGTAHISTGDTPSGALNYKQDSASVGVYFSEAPVGGTYIGFGGVSGDTTRISPRQSDTIGVRSRMNNGAVNGDAYTVEPKGHIVLRRNNSANYQTFKDGNYVASHALASTSVPTGLMTIFRTTTAYAPAGMSVAAQWHGGALTDAEIIIIDSSIRRALLALGVISSDEFSYPVGSATWFNDPRSIKLDSTTVLVGGVAKEGSIVANTLKDGEAVRQSIIIAKFQIDDHADPAFLKRASDNKLLALWVPHSGTAYWTAVSTNANDGSQWGTPVNIGAALGVTEYSYANPVQLTGEALNPVHLFLRAVTGVFEASMHHAVLDEAGAVTSAAVRVLTGKRPYFKIAQNGNSRIDIFCNDSGVTDLPTSNSLYHFYYEASAWHKSDGTLLGALPYTPATDLTRIYDGTLPTGSSWVWDGQIIAGNPSVAYAVYPTSTDHRYRRAVFSAGSWVDEAICAAGGAIDNPAAPNYSLGYYSGGICQDVDDANVVYCSRQVDGAGNIDTVSGIHQIFKYTKSGGVWTGQQLTFSTSGCFRPYMIAGTRKLQYIVGSYTDYTTFDTRIKLLAI